MTKPMTSPTPARDGAVPAGWKLVPVEPTDEMLTVGFNAGYEATGNYAKKVYAAMLASAPAPASGGVDADSLGELIYRALYQHEGGIWSAVDDRYKETIWNAAGLRLAAMLAPAPDAPPGEAVMWQTRMRPTWHAASPWSPWTESTKAHAEACATKPISGDWEIEARALVPTALPTPKVASHED